MQEETSRLGSSDPDTGAFRIDEPVPENELTTYYQRSEAAKTDARIAMQSALLRDPFQQAATVPPVEIEIDHVGVADVTTTRTVGAGGRSVAHNTVQVVCADVANDLVDKQTATYVASVIDGEGAAAGMTEASRAPMATIVGRQGIDVAQTRPLLSGVVGLLVDIDPQVGGTGQDGTHGFDRPQVSAHAHHAHAVAYAQTLELFEVSEELPPRSLAGVVAAPKGDLLGLRCPQPPRGMGQIRLADDLAHVGELAECHHGIAVVSVGERFASRGEEYAELAAAAVGHPLYESRETAAVGIEVSGRMTVSTKRAVAAPVVAAGHGATIEQRDIKAQET